MKLLLVDDNVAAVRAFERLLGLTYDDITTVASAENAFEALSKETFDVVICDLHMPLMSGVELCKQARTIGVVAPFIFITGDPSREALAAIRDVAGFLLLKPFTRAELEASVAYAARGNPSEAPPKGTER